MLGKAWTHNPEIKTWAEIKSQMLNQLNHPRTPKNTFWKDKLLKYSLYNYGFKDFWKRIVFLQQAYIL